jgi:phage gpG-like protein
MAGASITLDSLDVDHALSLLYAAAGDVTPALKNIGEYGARSTRQRFLSETDPEGNPWPDLNPLYAKTKKGPGKLRGETRALSQIIWQLVDETDVEWGSNEIYARIHNEGGKIVPKNAQALVFSMGGETFRVKSVTIPRRQFLGANERDIEEILGIVLDHFVEAVEGQNPSP